MFFKESALKNLAIFTGKYLGWIFSYRTPLVAAPNTTKKTIWSDLLVTDAVLLSASAVS